VYGWDQGIGLSEGVIGRWFAQGGGRREKVVLATKVFHASSPEWPHETWPNQKSLSALHIRRACEDSLRRLGTDHIDLYQMHYVDRSTPWEEIWQAMEQLVRKVKGLYLGSSNFVGWHIAQANDLGRARHLLGLVVEQCGYSLLSRNVEMEVLPACVKSTTHKKPSSCAKSRGSGRLRRLASCSPWKIRTASKRVGR
jgi:aryl-alcohol dehydrogenase-like predicted oxidoreductase